MSTKIKKRRKRLKKKGPPRIKKPSHEEAQNFIYNLIKKSQYKKSGKRSSAIFSIIEKEKKLVIRGGNDVREDLAIYTFDIYAEKSLSKECWVVEVDLEKDIFHIAFETLLADRAEKEITGIDHIVYLEQSQEDRLNRFIKIALKDSNLSSHVVNLKNFNEVNNMAFKNWQAILTWWYSEVLRIRENEEKK